MTDPKKDHWSAQTYSAAASFVPELTQKVLQYLDPQSGDHVLDIGCGDGKFTAKYLDSVASVYGVDASTSFIKSATNDYGSDKARFQVVDCRFLEKDAGAVSGKFDKVVSNAALHWILHDASTRMATLRACFEALKPGGRFVFEMGGAGNVAEAHTCLISALYHRGFSMAEAQDASPWFFPSETWMAKALHETGFAVQIMELEYRPTKLTPETEVGGGLKGWVQLMGADMLDKLKSEKERDEAVEEICGLLKNIVGRQEEDGEQYLGYVRLRGVAKKPKQEAFCAS